MRQTNIVWVGHALGVTAMDKLVTQTIPFLKDRKRSTTPYTFSVSHTHKQNEIEFDAYDLNHFIQLSFFVSFFQDVFAVLGFYGRRLYLVPKQIRLLCCHLFGYIFIILSFVLFVLWNGSIVVGDKQAHVAAIHVPQVSIYLC